MDTTDISLKTIKNTSQSFLKVTVGVWVDGATYWLRNRNEKIIEDEELSIHVKESSDHSKIKKHDVFIKNHGRKERKVKLLFIHQYPEQSKELFTFVSPVEQTIFHIKKEDLYLVSGYCHGRSVEQMTVQPLMNLPTDRIWQSYEDGILKYQPMGKGMMASIITFHVEVPSYGSCKASSWTIHGYEKHELLQMNGFIKKQASISF